jgi:hypothetical protein
MENMVVAMMLPPDVFYARELDKAMKVGVVKYMHMSEGGGGELLLGHELNLRYYLNYFVGFGN